MGQLIPFPLARVTGSPIAAELLFDLGDPFSYLVAEAAERTFAALAWTPVIALRAADADVAERAEARARALRLPLVWPERWPAPVPRAMRVAAYAVAEGRGAPFVLAASRLAFAGGYDLEDPWVLAEAAAAAGLAPGRAARAAMASALEPRRTVRGEHPPALRIGGTLYIGEACFSLALRRARSRASGG